jgi:3-deoxy-D-manno-octulosonic-acid transferase
MWECLYEFCMTVVSPFALGWLDRKGRQQTGHSTAWTERWGRIPSQPGPTFWIHASSLGELQVALNLVRGLHEQEPDLPIVMTTFTATAREQAEKALGSSTPVHFLPWDRGTWVERFLNRLEPAVGIIIETEIWPTLIHRASERGIRMAIVNGRISDRSLGRYERFLPLFGPALRRLDRIWAQNEMHARRFIALGVDPDRVRLGGNLKLRGRPSAEAAEKGQVLRLEILGGHPAWIAGSVREGEERMMLEAQQWVRTRLPQAIAVLAPRHPERAEAIQAENEIWRLPLARRSLGQVPEPGGILVLDTIGELTAFYAAGDAAFIGGSLVPLGGHNLIEAIEQGCPVIMGPSHGNVREAVDRLVQARAMAIIQDPDELAREVLTLLTQPVERADRAERALQIITEARTGQDSLVATLLDWWRQIRSAAAETGLRSSMQEKVVD